MSYRPNFDFRSFDSASVRLSANPTREISAQVSWAYLASPEQLESGTSVERLTASATWNHKLDETSDVGITAALGRNNPSTGPSTSAGLVEASLILSEHHTVFTRLELLEKTGQDLVLPAAMSDITYGMAAISAGYVYDFDQLGPIVPGLGVVGTVDIVSSALEPFYETRTPIGGMVFVRLRPPVMRMKTPMASGRAM